MHAIAMQPTQATDANFKQHVLRQCYEALAAAGFTRFRKEGVDWPLGNGFHCWVGLNTALNNTYVEINPFVGIHVVPIEKLWTTVKKGKYPGKYNRGIATYARHMGELAPDESVFHFTRQTDIDAEVKRLARLYATVGLAYANSIASYEVLLPLLQERCEMLGAYPERIASCLYLIGRKDEARSFVDGFVAQHREYFEGFATPFMAMLDREAAV
jgi:hypothetical protein